MYWLAGVADQVGDEADGTEAGEPTQVDDRLGVTGPLEHTALAGPQRKNVAGPGEVLGVDLGSGQCGDGSRLVGLGGAGGVALDEVDRDGEGTSARRLKLRNLLNIKLYVRVIWC